MWRWSKKNFPSEKKFSYFSLVLKKKLKKLTNKFILLFHHEGMW